MHEYSIAKELISTLLDQVDEEKLQNTTMVHLEIGELRVISLEALNQAFGIVTEETLLEGAKLKFTDVELYASCNECSFEGNVEYDDDLSVHFSVPVLSCPECGGSLEIINGNELSVKSLTVSDEVDDV